MPDRRAAVKLKTRDVADVEILATGSWEPALGGHWDVKDEDLTEIADNFAALRDLIAPPVKLGHDDGQLLLQVDGYPAAGWVDNVRKVGSKLLADLKKVPEKIADIIEAGGYRKVSVEVWKSMTVDGTTYSNVLTALALLGAELPAVSTLDDIVALYASRAPIALDAKSGARLLVVDAPRRRAAVDPDLSIDDQRALIDGALREKFGEGPGGYQWPWIEEMFEDRVVVTRDGRHWQIPFTFGEDGSVSLGTEVEVTQAWRPINGAGEAGDTVEEDDMADLKRIAKTLGLAETATEDEIVKAIGKRNAAMPENQQDCEAMGGTWSDGACKTPATDAKLASRVTVLEKDNAELRTQIRRRDAKEAVDAAVRARKVAPAEREWAEGYAEKDPQGFQTMVEKRPEILLASIGSEEGGDESDGDKDSMAKFKAKVDEKRKADPKLDVAAAQRLVSREDPELFAAAMGR